MAARLRVLSIMGMLERVDDGGEVLLGSAEVGRRLFDCFGDASAIYVNALIIYEKPGRK